MIYFHNEEVLGSNLGRDIGCPGRGASGFRISSMHMPEEYLE
jgi:hypothetical protein